MSQEDIERFVQAQTAKVKKNVEIVSKENLGQDYFLHISPDNMSGKKYIPWIGWRQGDNEDRTVPRITVAPHLVGCIYGYSSMVYNVGNYIHRYYIHKIPFEFALRPTIKLVYDADISDEHWLVRYNAKTSFYRPQLIGTLNFKGIEVDHTTKDRKRTIQVLVENREAPIPFIPGVNINTGIYTASFVENEYVKDIKEKGLYRIRKYTDTFATENRQPVYIGW